MLTEKNHEKIVDDCIARLNLDAPPAQLAHIFNELVGALWMRSSRTLSEVTLDAIFERALSLSKEQYPILDSFTLDHQGRRFKRFLIHAEGTGQPQQLVQAFRYFLVTVLTLFGNLTADILLSGLYQELQSFEPEQKEKLA